ncbi:citrate synthase-lysine N-methyltransferase CSKMT, mitochondrial [Hemicordylus capensis]|uniref:citrate synthase-lysine N-methyltransferase CSKMT, mitochondrial n=1 Tax=Hemicordylus capensis TaxID=884348 RepID=UPI00230434BE|nr:citrate synthase-lysine N-methyltransferase CSKMT, mitochondrial [Hemicordylus capensis]
MAAAARLAAASRAGLRRAWHASSSSSSSSPGSSSAWAEDLLRRMHQHDAWDRFYAEQGRAGSGPGHFDWFFGYRDVSPLLRSVLQGLPSGPARILDVGCGTSALGLGLYQDSARPLDISCLDFSPLAVATLRRLLEESPPAPHHPHSRLRCHLADATDLSGTFEAGSFHLVLDKGTCDTLLRCPQGPGRARRLVAECLWVLRPQGRLLQFSDEDPDARLPFLEQAGGADVTVREVGCSSGICYYAYLLGPRRTPDSAGSSGAVPEQGR